jgi:Meckelin (Transmembrane protein 67)
MLYDRFYRNKISQFSDILSLANISLLILNEKFHGYYIHGKSVHATADTSMEELNGCLVKEATDMVPRRGLGSSNQLNFELFITPDFRAVFNGIYRPSEGETARTMTMMNKLTLNDGTAPKFQEYKSPIGTSTHHLVRTYRMMTKFLQSFFEMVREYL